MGIAETGFATSDGTCGGNSGSASGPVPVIHAATISNCRLGRYACGLVTF